MAGPAGGRPATLGPVDDVDALLADLARWTADARAEDTARSRIRERWLRQQAAEDARFTGVALDLAERGTAVTVRTTTGRTMHGVIVTVARDFLVLRHHGGSVTFLASPAVATVRPEPGHPGGEAASERGAPVDAGLADVLAGLSGDRPRVRMVVAGSGEAVTGQLRAVGADVATLRLDGQPPATMYVQLGSLCELTLLG